MYWWKTWRADPVVKLLADRHYNRQNRLSPQFVPPGKCLVLSTENANAFWVTSAPIAAFVKHAWPGYWVCSAFRNESDILSSNLILDALSCSRFYLPPPDALAMVTFIDPRYVRRKRDYGRCYRKAGFAPCGETKSGLIALRIDVCDMPSPAACIGEFIRA